MAVNLLKKINPMSLVIGSILLHRFHDFAMGAVEASVVALAILLPATECTLGSG